jgi:hypothetical protein
MVIKSRRMGWAAHVARMGEVRNPYIILVGNSMKKPLVRSMHRLKIILNESYRKRAI